MPLTQWHSFKSKWIIFIATKNILSQKEEIVGPGYSYLLYFSCNSPCKYKAVVYEIQTCFIFSSFPQRRCGYVFIPSTNINFSVFQRKLSSWNEEKRITSFLYMKIDSSLGNVMMNCFRRSCFLTFILWKILFSWTWNENMHSSSWNSPCSKALKMLFWKIVYVFMCGNKYISNHLEIIVYGSRLMLVYYDKSEL